MIENYAIETYLRIRPSDSERKIGLKIRNVTARNGTPRQLLKVDIPPDADPSFIHNDRNDSGMLTFEFDKIFDESAPQEEVYATIAEKKVNEALDGINSTIFAYGQTGSGKVEICLIIVLNTLYLLVT